jgi:hypothetical protein
MPGLVPGIHVLFLRCGKDVDGRDKPGHDEWTGTNHHSVIAGLDPAIHLLRKEKNRAKRNAPAGQARG